MCDTKGCTWHYYYYAMYVFHVCVNKFMNSFECMRVWVWVSILCDNILKLHRLQTYFINDIYAWKIAIVRHEAHVMDGQLYSIQIWFKYLCFSSTFIYKFHSFWWNESAMQCWKQSKAFSSFYQLEFEKTWKNTASGAVEISIMHCRTYLAHLSLHSRTHSVSHIHMHAHTKRLTAIHLYTHTTECANAHSIQSRFSAFTSPNTC